MTIQNKNQAGFTVIELLAAAFVFSVLVAGVTMVFVRTTSLQRRAYAAEQIQSTTMAMIEAISRDTRVSDICTNPGVCSSSVLEMNHPIRGIVRYTYDSLRDVITITEGGITGDLTSSDVNYTNFSFTISNVAMDCRQPKITISFTAQNNQGIPFVTNMQTSITSRDLRKELLSPPAICP